MGEKLKGMRQRLRRPTYAEIVATLALFIALGGVSYAAVKIPNNSVGTKQLKKNSVNSSKVKNRSLLAADFKSGQLPRGATGLIGPIGPTGLIGPIGPTGLMGLAGQDGSDGATGSTGPVGATGPAGIDGSTGGAGPTGSTGQMGPTGFTGVAGGNGPTGTTGTTGATGSSSTAVLTGHSSLGAFPEYFATSGSSDATPLIGGSTSLSPAVAVTQRNLSVRLATAPGAGNIRSIFLFDDGSFALGCAMSGAQTTCQDTTSWLISPGSNLVMFSSTGGSPADTDIYFGFTLGP